jgi:hypothetical protein
MYISIVIGVTGCYLDAGQDFSNKYNQTEEYISRVGKRLLIISDSKNLNKINIIFKFKNTNKTFISINDNQIIITKGILYYLHDEAELAAILAIALVSLDAQNFSDFDERVINYLYKAGYDPMAFIELQQEYLINKRKKYNWLYAIFLNNLNNITKVTVNINKQLASSLSRGTQRFEQRYCSNIQTLKKLD